MQFGAKSCKGPPRRLNSLGNRVVGGISKHVCLTVRIFEADALKRSPGRVKGVLLQYDERRMGHESVEMAPDHALLCRGHCGSAPDLDTIPL